jgi:hypothetical protein
MFRADDGVGQFVNTLVTRDSDMARAVGEVDGGSRVVREDGVKEDVGTDRDRLAGMCVHIEGGV